MRSELRTNEAKLNALQSDVLSRRASRQAMLDQRRFAAIENIWAITLKYAIFRPAALAFTLLKLEAISKAAVINPGLREVVSLMKGGGHRDKFMEFSAESERPFLPESIWALFSAYSTVLFYAFIRLDVISMGIEESENFFSDDKVIALVKTVLPARAEYLDQSGIVGVAHLVDEMYQKLLAALKVALDGALSDQEGAEQSAAILRHVASISKSISDVEASGRA